MSARETANIHLIDDLIGRAVDAVTGKAAGGATDDPILQPPSQGSFTHDFIDAPELKVLGDDLIERYPNDLGYIDQFVIVYLWKKKGGAKGGRPVMGRVAAMTGMQLHFAQCHFTVWLAADHLRSAGERTIRASLFDTLAHIQPHPDTDTPVIVGDDLWGMLATVRHFQLWNHDLRAAETVIRQLRMPGMDE